MSILFNETRLKIYIISPIISSPFYLVLLSLMVCFPSDNFSHYTVFSPWVNFSIPHYPSTNLLNINMHKCSSFSVGIIQKCKADTNFVWHFFFFLWTSLSLSKTLTWKLSYYLFWLLNECHLKNHVHVSVCHKWWLILQFTTDPTSIPFPFTHDLCISTQNTPPPYHSTLSNQKIQKIKKIIVQTIYPSHKICFLNFSNQGQSICKKKKNQ